LKKNNNRGFTLAELLIVVAIIAVLVAVAIPVFTTQLEKSREATDLSNARSAYAELMVAVLDGDTTKTTSSIPGCVLAIDPTGDSTATITGLNQKIDGWTTDMTEVKVGGISPTGTPTGGASGTCTIKIAVDAKGNATGTVATALN